MANMGVSSMKLIDSDGDALDDGEGKLNVNATLVGDLDLDIGNVDILSIIPGTGATNLGKAEDAGHSSGDTGVMALGVRNDNLGSLVTTNADYAPLQVNALGALYVDLDVTAGNTKAFNQASATVSASQIGIAALGRMNDAVSAPAGHSDNEWTYFQTNLLGAIYTTGGEVEDAAVQSQPSLIGGRYDISPRGLNDGDAGAVAITAKGEVIVNVPSALQTWIAREDSAHSSADYGVTAMTVRNDVLASLTSDDGDYASLQVDAQGALYTTHGITGMVSDINTDIATSAEKIHAAADVAIKRIDIISSTANTGNIYVGDSGVSGDGLGGGIRLQAGDFYSLDIDNTADVYVAAEVDGEDVHYNYFT